MKEWLEYLVYWGWHLHFAHQHRYSLGGICIYKGEPRENPRGIPLVAWIYRCKCGEEVVQLEPSGIRLLQQGVDYDALIKDKL